MTIIVIKMILFLVHFRGFSQTTDMQCAYGCIQPPSEENPWICAANDTLCLQVQLK